MEGSQIILNYLKMRKSLPEDVTLVVASKHQTAEIIKLVYDAGQRIFGENKVQEMVEKKSKLPSDIEWHFIGNLQSNKVKYIAPFVSLIQSVSSPGLLAEIDKQAKKNKRTIDCLIEVHIASEESKQGFSLSSADELLASLPAEGQRYSLSQADSNTHSSLVPPLGELKGAAGASIAGLMGMATNTTDTMQLRREFDQLHLLYRKYQSALGLKYLSMGMTGDYSIAIEEGSNMVRIGTLIFGERL